MYRIRVLKSEGTSILPQVSILLPLPILETGHFLHFLSVYLKAPSFTGDSSPQIKLLAALYTTLATISSGLTLPHSFLGS